MVNAPTTTVHSSFYPIALGNPAIPRAPFLHQTHEDGHGEVFIGEGMDLLKEDDAHAIERLEKSIPQDIRAEVREFAKKGKRPISILEATVSILKWWHVHKDNLTILNNTSVVSTLTDGFLIKTYFNFLNSLHHIDLYDMGVGSRQWGWFVGYMMREHGIDIYIEAYKMLQRKEINTVREKESKYVQRAHFSLDAVDPYDYIRERNGGYHGQEG